jgi:hypothetical protein
MPAWALTLISMFLPMLDHIIVALEQDHPSADPLKAAQDALKAALDANVPKA